jgi:hypothetical protein
MNTYETTHRAKCPNGELMDSYRITIRSQATIMVEDILRTLNEAPGKIPRGFSDSATGKARGGSDCRGIAPRHPHHQHAPMNQSWKNVDVEAPAAVDSDTEQEASGGLPRTPCSESSSVDKKAILQGLYTAAASAPLPRSLRQKDRNQD